MLKKFRNVFFYVLIIGSFSALVYWIAKMGTKLEIADKIIKPTTNNPNWLEFLHSLLQNLGHPLAILLAQIVTIILAARIFGWICKKIGQPSVIGEIIAGIVLGPSLIGMYFPGFSAALSPRNRLVT